jgi:hypothetical protein
MVKIRFHFNRQSIDCYVEVHKFTPHTAITSEVAPWSERLRKKIKIEVEDDEGTHYTLALEGRVSRDKILKAVDMLEVVGVPIDQGVERPPNTGTFYGKVMSLIEAGFSTAEFSSSDVARELDERYNQSVRLSTVSTYLARLAGKGYLRRERFGNSWVYRRVYMKPIQSIER